jgi:hypothetical protein
VWGGPAAVRFSGGSFGAEIGGESTDIVMLVMNRHGMEKLASDKFTLGGDASIAAGPVGRTANAETDIQLHAEILAYSRTRGAFIGVSLDETVVSEDGSEARLPSALHRRLAKHNRRPTCQCFAVLHLVRRAVTVSEPPTILSRLMLRRRASATVAPTLVRRFDTAD